MPWLQRSPGGWIVRWRDGGRGGATHQSSVLPNRPKAEAEARRISQVLASAKPLRPLATITWAELVDRYIAAIPHTTQAHQRQIRQAGLATAVAMGWKQAADATVVAVEALPITRYRIVRLLLRHAAKLGQPLAPGVLFARRRRRETKNTVPAFRDQATIDALVAAASRWSPADGAIAHMVATYGHRVESLIKMRCRDVDGLHVVLTAKSGDTARRPITTTTGALLAALLHDRDPDAHLFIGHLGRPWKSGREYAGWWGHSIAAKGQGIVAVRKWATTQLYRACRDAKTVAALQMRRVPSLVLNIYAQSDDDSMRAAIASLPSADAQRCTQENT